MTTPPTHCLHQAAQLVGARAAMAICGAVCTLLLATGCEQSAEEKAKWAEEKRIECLDKFCEGDVPPKRHRPEDTTLKFNGQWLIGPRDYFADTSAVIYWPSRTPGYRGGEYPERGQPFYDIAIEVFLRSNNIPPEPRGYRLIELAQEQGWIASCKELRPGLDVIQMKHVIGPHGHYIDHVTYYVATELKGVDGLPPVAGCSHADPRNGGGTGFMWQPGIWAGTRMNQRHCTDWPEIYQEITRVLQLLKKA